MSTPVLGGYCSHDEGCSDRYRARGLCNRHYSQWWESDSFTPALRADVPPVCVCNEPEPGVFGECKKCLRSAHVDNADFREAWRARLNMTSAGSTGAPLPVEPADLAAPAAANGGASPAAGSSNLASK